MSAREPEGGGRSGGGGPPRGSELARHWMLDPEVCFLNHGSFGACPVPVLEAQAEFRSRMEREPVRFFVYDLEGLLDEARLALARFVDADAEGLALVSNATVGVNTVLRSLRFEPGDEIIAPAVEYPACRNALDWVARRWGAAVVSPALPWPVRGEDEIVEAVLGAVTPRTRLALLSHIVSPTGIILPIERLVRELDARGVDALVDGAHGPGQVDLSIRRIGAAYYTGNCHKWMCTPKGSALLHVREDRRDRISPLVIGHGDTSPRQDRSRFRLRHDWGGTMDPSPWLVIPRAIDFVGSLAPDGSGWAGVRARNRALALAGRDLLCRALGSRPPAPDSMIGHLAAVPLPAYDEDPRTRALGPFAGTVDGVQRALLERWKIQVPFVKMGERTRHVRISAQLYNSIEQYEYLAAALVEELGRAAE